MRTIPAVAVCAAAFLFAGASPAQPDVGAAISALRAEIAALTARLERLEQATASARAAPRAASVETRPATADARPTAATAPSLRFSGDVRYRHESIDEDGLVQRQRQRLRGRFGVEADVTPDVRVGLVLATGGDDPVSANQTLDDGFSRKPLGVDRAYFRWTATDALTFTGGKMPNPFFRPGDHHLIYDDDLNPEGLAVRYAKGDWFASYAGLWVEERGDADDSIMLGGQFGYRRTFTNGMRVTAGTSYYDYLETRGQTPFWDGAPAGNRVDAVGNYASDFNIAELFGELELEAGGRPLTLFADYVVNTEADAAERGFALGASFGKVAGPRTWRIGYVYQDLEADAVVGTFTDSDFAGGGTDGKGHVIELDYGLRERLVLGLRYFSNERGAAAGAERDYDRLQADVTFSY
jgi:hypothetical protein